jgi:hypothetical protein
MKKYFIILILFFSFSTCTYALLPIREIGLISGLGYGQSFASLPEGNYRPLYAIIHIGQDLTQYIKNENLNKGIFTMYNELQFNQVALGNYQFSEIEFGLNTGFKYMYPFYKKMYVFVSGGTGPFYFSTQTRQQKKGFIFNNNFGMGFSGFITRHIAIQAMFRIRHMSNAEIWYPNFGINTYNYHVGVSYYF